MAIEWWSNQPKKYLPFRTVISHLCWPFRRKVGFSWVAVTGGTTSRTSERWRSSTAASPCSRQWAVPLGRSPGTADRRWRWWRDVYGINVWLVVWNMAGLFSIIYWEKWSQFTFIFFKMVKTTKQMWLDVYAWYYGFGVLFLSEIFLAVFWNMAGKIIEVNGWFSLCLTTKKGMGSMSYPLVI